MTSSSPAPLGREGRGEGGTTSIRASILAGIRDPFLATLLDTLADRLYTQSTQNGSPSPLAGEGRGEGAPITEARVAEILSDQLTDIPAAMRGICCETVLREYARIAPTYTLLRATQEALSASEARVEAATTTAGELLRAQHEEIDRLRSDLAATHAVAVAAAAQVARYEQAAEAVRAAIAAVGGVSVTALAPEVVAALQDELTAAHAALVPVAPRFGTIQSSVMTGMKAIAALQTLLSALPPSPTTLPALPATTTSDQSITLEIVLARLTAAIGAAVQPRAVAPARIEFATSQPVRMRRAADGIELAVAPAFETSGDAQQQGRQGDTAGQQQKAATEPPSAEVAAAPAPAPAPTAEVSTATRAVLIDESAIHEAVENKLGEGTYAPLYAAAQANYRTAMETAGYADPPAADWIVLAAIRDIVARTSVTTLIPAKREIREWFAGFAADTLPRVAQDVGRLLSREVTAPQLRLIITQLIAPLRRVGVRTNIELDIPIADAVTRNAPTFLADEAPTLPPWTPESTSALPTYTDEQCALIDQVVARETSVPLPIITAWRPRIRGRESVDNILDYLVQLSGAMRQLAANTLPALRTACDARYAATPDRIATAYAYGLGRLADYIREGGEPRAVRRHFDAWFKEFDERAGRPDQAAWNVDVARATLDRILTGSDGHAVPPLYRAMVRAASLREIGAGTDAAATFTATVQRRLAAFGASEPELLELVFAPDEVPDLRAPHVPSNVYHRLVGEVTATLKQADEWTIDDSDAAVMQEAVNALRSWWGAALTDRVARWRPDRESAAERHEAAVYALTHGLLHDAGDATMTALSRRLAVGRTADEVEAAVVTLATAILNATPAQWDGAALEAWTAAQIHTETPSGPAPAPVPGAVTAPPHGSPPMRQMRLARELSALQGEVGALRTAAVAKPDVQALVADDLTKAEAQLATAMTQNADARERSVSDVRGMLKTVKELLDT